MKRLPLLEVIVRKQLLRTEDKKFVLDKTLITAGVTKLPKREIALELEYHKNSIPNFIYEEAIKIHEYLDSIK